MSKVIDLPKRLGLEKNTKSKLSMMYLISFVLSTNKQSVIDLLVTADT